MFTKILVVILIGVFANVGTYVMLSIYDRQKRRAMRRQRKHAVYNRGYN